MNIQKLLWLIYWLYNPSSKLNEHVPDYKMIGRSGRVALFQNGTHCVMAFRGDSEPHDAFSDILLQQGSFCTDPGLVKRFSNDPKRDYTVPEIPSSCVEITMTGHSLGGSVAEIVSRRVPQTDDVVTFGQPRSCCSKNMTETRTVRIIDSRDLIPGLPFVRRTSIQHCSTKIMDIKTKQISDIPENYKLPRTNPNLSFESHTIESYLESIR